MKLYIRQERERRQWAQEYIANQVGVTPETIHYLETGQRKPSYDVLVKLLDLFECNDPRILFGAATPNTEKPGGNRAIPKEFTQA